jgi:proteic killer suppression protein
VIKSFGNKDTEKIFKRQYTKKFPLPFHRAALRKLRMINRAQDLNDLRVHPGNKLKALKGRRKGQYSIRINDQWRICFIWKDKDAFGVEISNYH